jgi:hypothetical protein
MTENVTTAVFVTGEATGRLGSVQSRGNPLFWIEAGDLIQCALDLMGALRHRIAGLR